MGPYLCEWKVEPVFGEGGRTRLRSRAPHAYAGERRSVWHIHLKTNRSLRQRFIPEVLDHGPSYTGHDLNFLLR